MTTRRQDPQDRAIKVLVGLIKSHQGILGLVRQNPACPVNLRAADDAVDAAGRLLNDLRLGEVKVTAWELVMPLLCVECGNSWMEGREGKECPECGGQCYDA